MNPPIWFRCHGESMSDRKGKGKSRKLPRSKKNNAAPRKGTTRTSRGTSRRTDSSPTALNTRRSNPTTMTMGQFVDRQYGVGIRISGMQSLCSVIAGSDTAIFGTGTSSTATTTGNQSILSPDYLNGRLQALALTYDRYRFRSVRYEYEPLCATTQAGGLALAFCQDSDFVSSDVETTDNLGYSTLQEFTPSSTFAFRDRGSLSYTYNGDQVWYCLADTSLGTDRLTNQGLLLGYPSTGGLAASMGNLRIHYVIELFGNVTAISGEVMRRFRSLAPAERKSALSFMEELASHHSSKDVKKSGQSSSSSETKEIVQPAVAARFVSSSSSSSASSASASGMTSQSFRAPSVNERYVLVTGSQ